MKILLEYDEASGQVTDAAGVMPICYLGLKSFEPDSAGLTVKEIVKLKDAGFSAEEITELKSGGVI